MFAIKVLGIAILALIGTMLCVLFPPLGLVAFVIWVILMEKSC